MKREVLEWHGDAGSVLALEAVLGRGPVELALRLPRESPLVPEFVLQAQAAALGFATTQEPSTAAPTPREDALEDLVARGYRAVVVASRDAWLVGRVLDAQVLRDARHGGAGSLETFVFDGPRFKRRVDVVAYDAEPTEDGWRVPLGLRGC